MAESGSDSDLMERVGGGFRKRLLNADDIEISDFQNPWNFYKVFSQEDSFVVNWCIRNGLMPNNIPCVSKVTVHGSAPASKCDGIMKLSQRSGKSTGYTLRCSKNRNHEVASRKYSFFESSKLTIQDIMMFTKSYLEGHSLFQCSRLSGVYYKSTGVDWGTFVREVLMEHFYRHTKTKKLKGQIEIDESMFGRRVKHNRGNPNRGLKVWIFGMVERDTNTVILYPVNDRSSATLIPLILRHVEVGSMIFSDGWSAYLDLNSLGYQHFSVIHKYTFKAQYRNIESGEFVTVHTNQIEGAWKHAKQHFKRMSGTNINQFEGHLAEIIWRSHVKGNLYVPFFDALKEVYTLQGPPSFNYTTPLFDSWQRKPDEPSSFAEWTVVPTVTDAETESENSSQSEADVGLSDVISITSGSEPDLTCAQRPPVAEKGAISKRTRDLLHEMFSSSSEDEADKTLYATVMDSPATSKTGAPEKSIKITLRKKTHHATSTISSAKHVTVDDNGDQRSRLFPLEPELPTLPARHVPATKKSLSKKAAPRMRTDKVCHPEGFSEVPSGKRGKRGKRSKSVQKPANPYGKDAFAWSSSDSDFA